MFNNLWTGLPIARALVISFPEDSSLVGENAEFLDTEYTVGDDLLVAPVLEPKGTRTVYLPRPTAWWQCNLQAEGPDKATELLSCHEFNGGSLIEYDAHMHRGGKDLSFITPMFIRFGGIIPQTEPGLYAEDWKPISLHIYPGHVNADRSYAMYVDDGLSAWSAPTIQTIQSSLIREGEIPPSLTGELWDEVKDDGAFSSSKARDVFWKFEISHVTNYSSSELKISRNIKFKPKHRAEPKPPSEPKPEPKPDPDSGERLLDSTSGIWCRLIIWGEPKRKEAFKKAEFSGRSDSFEKGSSWPTKDQNGPIRVRYEPDQNAWHVLLDLREEHDFTVSYASSM
ncbi:hypothetical protein FRC12_016578 [Ceratobasidium sp. 428]|nr:hypothetical protein FRC12_016578 [Ceratobasidium sp. 428]